MKHFILFLFFCTASSVMGQSLNTNLLFSPNLNYKGSFQVPTNDFEFNKNTLQLVFPLRTKLSAGINKEKLLQLDPKALEFRAKQDFIYGGVSRRSTKIAPSVYTYTLGYTGVRADLHQGIWAYSLNAFVTEPASAKGIRAPNALAFAVRIKLNNLKFIYFYGASIVYRFNSVTPVPLLGFTWKLAPRLRLTTILPVQSRLRYKINARTSADLLANLEGMNAIYKDRASYDHIDYTGLELLTGLNKKIGNSMNLTVLVGVTVWNEMTSEFGGDRLNLGKTDPQPIVKLTMGYKLGKSLLFSKILGVD